MRTLLIAVLCAGCSVEVVDAPETEEVEVFETVSAWPYSEGVEVVATCPDETVLVEGECFADGPGKLELFVDEQAGQGWRCMAFETAGKGARLRAIAVCQ